MRQRIKDRWLYARLAGQEPYEAVADMRRHDKYVLHGFSPCDRCGLALRSRNFNCLNCHPKQLEHVFRYTEPGYIYVLWSNSARLIKVGCTSYTAAKRAGQLNDENHAGVQDWMVWNCIRVSRRGLFEDQLKTSLAAHYVRVPFTRYGKNTWSRETFNCAVDDAWRAIVRLKRNYLKRYRERIEA